MVAAPSTSDYGRLSVMLQEKQARMENALFVLPEAFDPPPRVDSAGAYGPARRLRAA